MKSIWFIGVLAFSLCGCAGQKDKTTAKKVFSSAMPTFDEILSGQGYHCEYYGKWHSQTSHTTVYKNPEQAAANGKSVFGHGGQRYVHLDYLEGTEPI